MTLSKQTYVERPGDDPGLSTLLYDSYNNCKFGPVVLMVEDPRCGNEYQGLVEQVVAKAWGLA